MVEQKILMAPACKEFEQDLILYYYGDLSGTDRSNVEHHVRGCQSCATYLKELNAFLPMTVQPDEPPQSFWDNYSREMRQKLADTRERKTGWQKWVSLFQPWAVPALATTAVVALALTFTLGKGIWNKDLPSDGESLVEVLPMAEDLEFFKTMEVLDAMDLLEYLGAPGNGTA